MPERYAPQTFGSRYRKNLWFQFVEETFYTIEPAFASRRMLAIRVKGVFQLLQQSALLVSQLDRRLHNHLAQQIANATTSHLSDTFPARGGRFCRFAFLPALSASLGHPESAHPTRHRAPHQGTIWAPHSAGSTIALENRMRFDVDLHKEITGWATIRTRLALAGQSDSVSHIYPRRDFHG